MSKPAARITDNVAHPLPPVLTGGPGSPNVLIGNLRAWRGIPGSAVAALQSAKQASDTAIQAAESATKAAAGTPGAPAALAAEQATKATASATMSSMISAAAASASSGMADIHQCATPLPIPPHGPGVVIDGSKTVLINGLPACRMGDTILEALGPTNKIVKGEVTVLIGG
ncbi:MAG: PAAR domain-containing protein [Cuspidothrix sp.]